MGFDWRDEDEELESGGKLNWKAIIFIVAILVVVALLASCASSTVRIPRSVSSPDWADTPPRIAVQSSPVPTSTPKQNTHKPSPASTTIYVVSHVNSLWHVGDAIIGWKLAKYTDFKLVKQCPVTAPCVTIRMNESLPSDTAAETSFTTNPNEILMDLNPVVTSSKEAENTVSHELGHVLGAPHIVGTLDTVMAPIGVYRVLPTRLDVRVVDALGRWDSEKMYENSGKTLDMSHQPN